MRGKTLTDFLKTALIPAHRVMYVWGGGWEGSGDLGRLGLNPKWEAFYRDCGRDYDFKKHKFEKEKGLDCSGYVGWVMTNFLGGGNHVAPADSQAPLFAGLGLGEYIKAPSAFLAGDVVSGNGHVYIAVSECLDKSLILLHSSPPGVQLCAASDSGEKSEAAALAQKCVQRYYIDWHKKFELCVRGGEYIKNVSSFRFFGAAAPDRDGLRRKPPAQVLKILFGDDQKL